MADRACVVLLQHGRLLMVHQTYAGKTFWTFPGGSIEPGESPETAAIREAKEETCLDIDIVRSLCKTARATTTGTYHCYLGRIVGGTAMLGHDPELPMGSQELHALRWVAVDEVYDHPEVALIREVLVELIAEDRCRQDS